MVERRVVLPALSRPSRRIEYSTREVLSVKYSGARAVDTEYGPSESR